jgi:hypothetical protein
VTYSPATEDDLTALRQAVATLEGVRTSFSDIEGSLDLIHSRLSQPAPPPPPPEPALPAVGVVGGSSWNGLTPVARQDALGLMAQAGITHFRVGVPWSSVERTKGVYGLDLYRTLVREVVHAGLIPVAVLGYTPPHYRLPGGDMFSQPTPAGIAAYHAFCLAVFRALVPLGCFRYEVWNEPNHAGPPGMAPVSAKVHAQLCFEAHTAAANTSRHIRLVAGAISPAPDKPPSAEGATLYLQNTLAAKPGFFDFVDEWSIHPYPGLRDGKPNRLLDGWFWRQQYASMRPLVPQHVPISATECGFSTFDMTEEQQAAGLVDAIQTWPEAGPFYIFNWRDWGQTPARDNRQGLARLDGTLRPAYFAVKNLLTG